MALKENDKDPRSPAYIPPEERGKKRRGRPKSRKGPTTTVKKYPAYPSEHEPVKED